MLRRKIQLLIISLVLSLGFAANARAQAVYGSISGTVTDTSGAAIAGATVTIRSIERNTVDTVTTNESGLYVKERLIPGAYEVKVEFQGFKQKIVSSVTVSVILKPKWMLSSMPVPSATR